MKPYRVRRTCTIDGVTWQAGKVVFYDGPLRAELEPYDPAEHASWVEAGYSQSQDKRKSHRP